MYRVFLHHHSNFDFADRTENLHFLAAKSEEELDSYEASLCHVYPTPFTRNSQVEWFPCSPPKIARYFKIMMIMDHGNYLQAAKLDIYGY